MSFLNSVSALKSSKAHLKKFILFIVSAKGKKSSNDFISLSIKNNSTGIPLYNRMKLPYP
ncbi:hypothetical protein CAPSP0001_1277 [Capnocytophaga sputigena ATCC 33612]|nr:hypothetical protein CAPSP0001_1277 [Capnocytophaga sputigena ATCC 33612]